MKKLIAKMNALEKTNRLELSVATSMLANTSDRIFSRGQDANGSPIGKYSKAYLKQRVKKGYSASPEVILQATRQMANDFSVISTGSELGLGFKNSANADKSRYVEATYNKTIFQHTNQEVKEFTKLINIGIKKVLQ